MLSAAGFDHGDKILQQGLLGGFALAPLHMELRPWKCLRDTGVVHEKIRSISRVQPQDASGDDCRIPRSGAVFHEQGTQEKGAIFRQRGFCLFEGGSGAQASKPPLGQCNQALLDLRGSSIDPVTRG